MTIATATTARGSNQMGCVIERPAIIEPDLVACPVLTDGELTYDNGMFYFVGWSYSPTAGGHAGRYSVSVRAAACPLVTRKILGNASRLLLLMGH